MYRSNGNYEAFARPRKPEGADDKTVWLVGGGLAAMAAAIFFLGLGIAFWQLWLVAIGAVLLIWTTTQLNLQYGIPREKH